ncbi:MAG: hypothetical protein ABW250_12040 [Pyrinomonadaceae bacterium]
MTPSSVRYVRPLGSIRHIPLRKARIDPAIPDAYARSREVLTSVLKDERLVEMYLRQLWQVGRGGRYVAFPASVLVKNGQTIRSIQEGLTETLDGAAGCFRHPPPHGHQRFYARRRKPMTTKKVQKRGASRKSKPTAEVKAEAEAFKREAVEYAQTAYAAALAHYEANLADPFALSRLAVVYDETQPGDVHMVVTLPSVVNENVSADEARDAIRDAELLARTLEHEGCTEGFRKAFGVIFTEHVLDGSDVTWTTPTVMRVMLPLALLQQWRYRNGSGITPAEILITLSSELVSDEVSENVRRSLSKT